MLLATLAAAAGALCLSASADAFVYWGSSAPGGKIGRAGTDGTNPNPDFLPIPSDPGNGSPCGVAVNSAHIYFANQDNDSIGRANLNGTGVDPSFITLPANSIPCGIAVDGSHVFWADIGDDEIGRANLDGSVVTLNFIPGLSNPCGVAVDGSFVYWGHDAGTSASTVGRATIAGTSPNESFITGADNPCGVAVNATHIFWANRNFIVGSPDNTIGRDVIGGGSPNQSFITTGVSAPTGVALNSTHVLWANAGDDTISRAELDGSPVDTNFITGVNSPLGIAVDDFPHTSSTSLSCAPSSVLVNQPSTCTATVTDTASANQAPPGGTVGFSSNAGGSFGSGGNCALSAINATQSSCSLTFRPASSGVKQVTGDYTSDGLHADGSDAANVIASVRSTSTAVSCTPPEVGVAQPATCEATVSDTAGPGSPVTPTGTMTFSSSSGSLTPATCGLAAAATGKSRCSVAFAPGATGGHTVQASYGGSGAHSGSGGSGAVEAGKLALGKAKLDKKKGTAKLTVDAPGPGSVELSGKGLKGDDAQLAAAGEATLSVKAKGKTKKDLKKKGKAKVKPEVTFTPSGGGETGSEKKTVKLKRR